MSHPNNPTPQPQTLISGHAQYAKGAAESAIGSVSGNQAWATAGEQDKNAAVEGMRAAAAENDNNGETGEGLGVEKAVGKAVGCEGMVREGGGEEQKK